MKWLQLRNAQGKVELVPISISTSLALSDNPTTATWGPGAAIVRNVDMAALEQQVNALLQDVAERPDRLNAALERMERAFKETRRAFRSVAL